MLNQDKLIIETYEKKNELESIIYNFKEKLTGVYSEYAKQDELNELVKYLE
jgi:hypothetical protein